MTAAGPDARLVAAFLATSYRVFTEDGAFALRIGQRDRRFDAVVLARGGRSWAIITAANPAARRVADGDNALAQQALQARVGALGLLSWPTRHQADDGAWPDEEGVLLLNADADDAGLLAREFGQCAFVIGGVDRAPELVWIDVP